MSYVLRHVCSNRSCFASNYDGLSWSDFKNASPFSTLKSAKAERKARGGGRWYDVTEVTYGVRWYGANGYSDDEDAVYFTGTDGAGEEYFWSSKRKEAKRFATKADAKAAIHMNHRGFARVVRFLRKVA